jgi:hypothetical protein
VRNGNSKPKPRTHMWYWGNCDTAISRNSENVTKRSVETGSATPHILCQAWPLIPHPWDGRRFPWPGVGGGIKRRLRNSWRSAQQNGEGLPDTVTWNLSLKVTNGFRMESPRNVTVVFLGITQHNSDFLGDV